MDLSEVPPIPRTSAGCDQFAAEVESLREQNGKLHVAVEAEYQHGYNDGADETRAEVEALRTEKERLCADALAAEAGLVTAAGKPVKRSFPWDPPTTSTQSRTPPRAVATSPAALAALEAMWDSPGQTPDSVPREIV